MKCTQNRSLKVEAEINLGTTKVAHVIVEATQIRSMEVPEVKIDQTPNLEIDLNLKEMTLKSQSKETMPADTLVEVMTQHGTTRTQD